MALLLLDPPCAGSEGSPSPEDRKTEPWPWLLVALFTIFFVALGILIHLSLKSWNGTVIEEHYTKGLNFNQIVAVQKEQDALGWQTRWQAQGLMAGRPGTLTWILQDRAGNPIAGAYIKGRLHHVINERWDRDLMFQETAPGRYEARMVPAQEGAWEVRLDAQAGEVAYRQVERITVHLPKE